jgi:hypothetical protein
VSNLYGFESEAPSTSMEALLSAVSHAVWDKTFSESRDGTDASRLIAAMYSFSDIQGDLGDQFGKWLLAEKLGAVVEMKGRNPNTKNRIVTYLWRPNMSALNKRKEWREGRTAAKSSREWGRGYY